MHASAVAEAGSGTSEPWWKRGPLIPALAAAYRNEWPLSRAWEPPAPRLGRLDFWRVHALALDRLGDVLDRLLPEGEPTPCGTYWHGARPPERPLVIRVSLLAGTWHELDTGKGDADVVSLTAHCLDLDPWRAARLLCRLLDVPEVVHA